MIWRGAERRIGPFVWRSADGERGSLDVERSKRSTGTQRPLIDLLNVSHAVGSLSCNTPVPVSFFVVPFIKQVPLLARQRPDLHLHRGPAEYFDFVNTTCSPKRELTSGLSDRVPGSRRKNVRPHRAPDRLLNPMQVLLWQMASDRGRRQQTCPEDHAQAYHSDGKQKDDELAFHETRWRVGISECVGTTIRPRAIIVKKIPVALRSSTPCAPPVISGLRLFATRSAEHTRATANTPVPPHTDPSPHRSKSQAGFHTGASLWSNRTGARTRACRSV